MSGPSAPTGGKPADESLELDEAAALATALRLILADERPLSTDSRHAAWMLTGMLEERIEAVRGGVGAVDVRGAA